MSIMCDYVEHLLCTYRLPVLTQMKTLTVYHVGDLFAAHPPVGGDQAIHYGIFYLHMTKILHFSEYRNILGSYQKISSIRYSTMPDSTHSCDQVHFYRKSARGPLYFKGIGALSHLSN